jgi:hypothetical protein
MAYRTFVLSHVPHPLFPRPCIRGFLLVEAASLAAILAGVFNESTGSMAFRASNSLAALVAMRRLLVSAAASASAALFLVLNSTAACAETLMAGPDASPMSLEDAVRTAKDGDTIQLLSGEYRGTLLIENRKLTIVGMGAKPPVMNGEGKVRATRALWTVRGGEVTLQNLEFRGSRSVDSGGAGVRMEGGKLTVTNVGFYDNEHGLVTTNEESAELAISNSVFGAAPHVVGGLYHLLNVGRISKLSITATRFQQGFEGHLIKTRAKENLITYNFIHDGVRGGASYEIEVARGGVAVIVGNVIAQGADARNPVLLAYGTEGRAWEKNELYVAHNTFVNYAWTPAWFMRVATDQIPGVVVHAVNNLLVGPGLLWPTSGGHFEGNRYVTRGMLRDTATYGFELPAGAMWRGAGIDPRNINGHDLSPKGEFEWPVNIRELKPGATQWTPGAYQR